MTDYRIEDLPPRLQAKIRVNLVTGCWEWQGWRSPPNWGYGYVWWEGKDRSAHRVVFTLLAEPIPDGLTLDHVEARGCASKACCWPAHLEPVTTRENTYRFYGLDFTDDRAQCGRGHDFTPENTYITPDDKIRCRACQREDQRRSKTRKVQRWGC